VAGIVLIGNIAERANKAEEAGVVVGIDLGTTNSVVSLSNGQIPSVLQLPQSSGGLVKSCVHVEGAIARSFKRYMETPEEPFAAGQTPITLSTDMLRLLKEETEFFLGQNISGAVITVPARFSNIARKATKQAAQNAGINVIRLLNEPTAAAIAYGLNAPDANGIFVVYDFGGGTFDATILRIENGVFQVLGTSGDLFLGGDDIDQALLDYLNLENTEENKTKMQNLKEAFSRHLELEASEQEAIVPRDIFDSIVKKYVDKTLHIVQNLLADVRMEPCDVDGVILIGGSTRLRYVPSALAGIFGEDKIKDTINPDCAVSIGAALHAEALTSNTLAERPLLLDIVPASLGLETVMGCVETIIPKYTPTPVSTTVRFSTFYNNQTNILIHIVQGDDISVEKCTSLGKLVLSGIQPMPSGAPQILVVFNVDDNGLLFVSAHEETCDIKRTLQIDFCTNVFRSAPRQGGLTNFL
jgi:molecular chaperone HscA